MTKEHGVRLNDTSLYQLEQIALHYDLPKNEMIELLIDFFYSFVFTSEKNDESIKKYVNELKRIKLS